jgi:hypothetical protein
MPSLFKRKRGDDSGPAPAPPRRRRYLPQDQFRQDVVHQQAAELVALEERVREVDRLLAARSSRSGRSVRCSHCGAALFPGTRFCPSCGQALEPQAGS